MNWVEWAALLAGWNLAAMAGWAVAACGALAFSLWQCWRDGQDLKAVRELTQGLNEQDHAGKLAIQDRLFDWARANEGSSLAYGIAVGNNASLGGAVPDASAITDAIWSRERLRHGAFKFFQRHVILLGLFFTSAGLVATLGKLGPVVGQSTQNYEAWTANVREALGASLAGMGHAFSSSLLALLLALVLQGLWLLLAEGPWNRHLMEVDTLLQGRVIPVFTAVVQRDRNDVITLAMSRIEAALLAVRDQYAHLLKEASQSAEHLAQLQAQLQRSSLGLKEASDALAKEHQSLASVAPAYKQGAEVVAQATLTASSKLESSMAVGLQLLDARHQELAQVVAQQNHHLGALAEHGQAQLAQMALVGDRLAWQTDATARVVGPLQATGDQVQAMHEAVASLMRGVQALASVMQSEESAWVSTWAQRRHEFEENLRQLGQVSGQVLARELVPMLNQYLQQVGQLMQQELQAAHQAQREAESARDRRWNELVGALSGRA